MAIDVTVIAKHPPGARSTLYAGYARVLETVFAARAMILRSDTEDANNRGFPSLIINNMIVQPTDGLMVMPKDVVNALQECEIQVSNTVQLLESLHIPLNRLLEQAE